MTQVATVSRMLVPALLSRLPAAFAPVSTSWSIPQLMPIVTMTSKVLQSELPPPLCASCARQSRLVLRCRAGCRRR